MPPDGSLGNNLARWTIRYSLTLLSPHQDGVTPSFGSSSKSISLRNALIRANFYPHVVAKAEFLSVAAAFDDLFLFVASGRSEPARVDFVLTLSRLLGALSALRARSSISRL